MGLREDDYITNTSINRWNNIVKEINIVKYRDEEVTKVIINKVIEVVINKGIKVVINNEVSKEVINNNKEVFSVFNDSRDKDYRENSKDIVEDNEGGLSEVEINRSNNKEYKESSRVVSNKEEEGLSNISINKSNNNNGV